MNNDGCEQGYSRGGSHWTVELASSINPNLLVRIIKWHVAENDFMV